MCAFSEAIRQLYSAPGLLSGVEAMLPELGALFRSQHVSVDLTSFDGSAPQLVAMLHSDEYSRLAHLYERTFYLSPKYEGAKNGAVAPVIRTSADLAQGVFRKCAFYREVFARAGWADQLGISVAFENKTLGINLHRDSPFSDEEAQLALLLQQHLSRCCRDRRNAQASAAGSWDVKLTVKLVPQSLPDPVAKLFGQYFSTVAHSSGLPNPIVHWIRRQLSLSKGRIGSAHLRVASQEGALFLWLRKPEPRYFVLTVQERKKHYNYDRLSQLGLTGRQIEIAFWLTQGKTDGEMAILLDISPRTANKHVETILCKLGCCNRTLAAVNIVEFLTGEV